MKIGNKRKRKEIKRKIIVEEYKKDLDSNEDSVRRLEKELNENLMDYTKVILIIDDVIKMFKKKYPNEV
jgi:hypothetical protein